MTTPRPRRHSRGTKATITDVLNALPAQAAVLDKDGRIIAVNGAWERSVKEHGRCFPRVAGIGDNYVKACRQPPSGYAEKARETLSGLLAVLNGSLDQFMLEYRWPTPTAAQWFLLCATPVSSKDGGAVVSYTDITIRKRVEEVLHEALTEGERIRTRLNTLYAAIPIGLIYLTPDLVVERVSQQIAEIHGRSIEEHIGRQLSNLIPRERWTRLKRIYDRVLKSGKPYHSLEEGMPDARVSGGTRYFLSDFYPERNEEGAITGIHTVMREITDQKLALLEHARHLKDLEAKNRELDQKAIRDPLTGLYNRWLFDEVLTREWKRFQRSGEAFTVVIMDVDAFKAINDQYGHETGDRALQQVGTTLRASLRESDMVARVGGDEFAALLPRTDKDRSAPVVKKLRDALNRLRVSTPTGSIPLTLSLGTATVPGFPPVTSAAEVLRIADKRMYEAKRLVSSGKADPR